MLGKLRDPRFFQTPEARWGLLAAVVLVVTCFAVGGALKPQRIGEFRLDDFASLPVQYNGRPQPVETVARNALRTLSGTTSVRHVVTLPNGQTERVTYPALLWLLELTARPERADELPVFRVDHPDVRHLMGLTLSDGKRVSFSRLEPRFEALRAQAAQLPTDAKVRTAFHKGVAELYQKLDLYFHLSQSFHPLGGTDALLLEYAGWELSVEPGLAAMSAREAGETFDEEAFNRFTFLTDRYLRLSRSAKLGILPNPDPQQPWLNVGDGLLGAIQSGTVDPTLTAHARLTVAWRNNDATAFNAALDVLHQRTDTAAQHKVSWEVLLQRSELFYQLATLYALLLVGFGVVLIRPWEPLRMGLVWATATVFVWHTVGILARMYLQGYPPVTNLYSSAIFIGWAAVGLGLYLEKMFKAGFGGFCAGLIGFSTLVVAANLYETSAAGDTLEPMRAVLNSNFWLATHVVIVTLGYCAVFLAGALAIVYVIKRAVSGAFTPVERRDLARMVYGVTCFGLLFSFVGTFLGGVWADQSWGRFWGWDPKENGALMIVLWGALMLHARWGGFVKERGFMLLAIGGNIITAWSWFGTNMLGVGLHTYGFMDSAFFALNGFWLSQILLMAAGFLPDRSRSRAIAQRATTGAEIVAAPAVAEVVVSA